VCGDRSGGVVLSGSTGKHAPADLGGGLRSTEVPCGVGGLGALGAENL